MSADTIWTVISEWLGDPPPASPEQDISNSTIWDLAQQAEKQCDDKRHPK